MRRMIAQSMLVVERREQGALFLVLVHVHDNSTVLQLQRRLAAGLPAAFK